MGSVPRKPELVLSPMTREEIPTITDVYFPAFKVYPIIDRALPNTPGVTKWWEATNSHEFEQPNCRFMKVVDLSAEGSSDAGEGRGKGKFVGYAEWFLPLEQQGAQEETFSFHEDTDIPIAEWLFGNMAVQQKKIMGDRPYYCTREMHSPSGRSCRS